MNITNPFVLLLSCAAFSAGVCACSHDSVGTPEKPTTVLSSSRVNLNPPRKVPTDVVSYAVLDYVSSASMRPVSLCELVKGLAGPSGVYRVVALQGAAEVRSDGVPDPHTYVALDQISTWTPTAPKSAIARIPGGPLPNKNRKSWLVGLKVGEVVGVHLYKYKGNLGYYGLHPLGVWRENGAGFVTNGQLSTKTKRTFTQIGQLVAQVAAKTSGCAVQMVPDGTTQSTHTTSNSVKSYTSGTPVTTNAQLVKGGTK